MSVAIRNAKDGISLAQTADRALGEISNLVQRLRELAVQSANGTVSDADRESIQSEATPLISQIDDIANNTSFHGVKLTEASQATALGRPSCRALLCQYGQLKVPPAPLKQTDTSN